MKLEKIRVKNFRSIKSECILEFNNKKIIVGPNNSGKTNLLKSIYILFNNFNKNIYNINSDLPFGIKNEQTSIVAYFKLEDRDIKIKSNLLDLYDLLDISRDAIDRNIVEFNIYLNFSNNGKASYKIFTNEKILNDKKDLFRSKQDELISEILGNFSCNYIPSEKHPTKIYNDFLVPKLKDYVGDLLSEYYDNVVKGLEKVSSQINENIKSSGMTEISCEFGIPDNKFSELISGFDFFIDDGRKTEYLSKGSGIQAAISLSFLSWVNEKEREKGKNVIWLIEEPESYLHPGLIDACGKIIDSISNNSQVILTTHAIGFVPSDHNKTIETKISNGETVVNIFRNYSESTHSIRESLGLRFSDFYNLGEYNIFVEGKTDKMIIEILLSIIKPKGKVNSFEKLRKATIIEFSGVTKLKDFLKSTYSFMCKERKILVVFDGDGAGIDASKELVNFFRNKSINFSSNKEYIILPNGLPIEGLFPIDWLEELHDTHSKWISVEKDTNGKLVNISMNDEKKSNINSWLLNKAQEEIIKNDGIYPWAGEFIKVFTVMENALNKD